MLKKYSRSHIGEIFNILERLGGYKATIINGGSKIGYVTVQIEDWIGEFQYSKLKLGTIKYPRRPSVYNVGHSVTGEFRKKNNKVVYDTWKDMLRRCYDPKQLEKRPTYKECFVDKEWHSFQNFAKWYYKYYPKDGKKYELDKDIRVPGNKIYSSYTCMFVQSKLNSFMTNIKSHNTSGYIGASWDKYAKKWKASILIDGKIKHLGLFCNKKDASVEYEQARAIEASRLRAYYSFEYPKETLDNIK